MKRLILITILALPLFVAAQPITPGITNIPTVNLGAEKIGLSEAIISDGEESRMGTIVDYNLNKTFFLRGECQIHNGSELFRSMSLGAGLYKSWDYARVYAFAMGSRNFDANAWEGNLGIGMAYTPFHEGIAERFSLFTEGRVTTDFSSRTQPQRILAVGIRYSF
jgi:hypothetical protein